MFLKISNSKFNVTQPPPVIFPSSVTECASIGDKRWALDKHEATNARQQALVAIVGVNVSSWCLSHKGQPERGQQVGDGWLEHLWAHNCPVSGHKLDIQYLAGNFEASD